MTTLKTTAPSGVSSTVFSCCVQVSDPGAVPGHTFTVCAPPAAVRERVSASAAAVLP
jgi:hypothetical protein